MGMGTGAWGLTWLLNGILLSSDAMETRHHQGRSYPGHHFVQSCAGMSVDRDGKGEQRHTQGGERKSERTQQSSCCHLGIWGAPSTNFMLAEHLAGLFAGR